MFYRFPRIDGIVRMRSSSCFILTDGQMGGLRSSHADLLLFSLDEWNDDHQLKSSLCERSFRPCSSAGNHKENHRISDFIHLDVLQYQGHVLWPRSVFIDRIIFEYILYRQTPRLLLHATNQGGSAILRLVSSRLWGGSPIFISD